MTGWTIVEPTQALRDWARTEATIAATFATRGYAGGLPAGATFPAWTIRRIGGGLDDMVDVGLYQLDVWANRASDAASAASVLAQVLGQVANADLGGDLVLAGATVQTVIAVTDPNPDLQRVSLTVQITTKSNTNTA